MSRPERFLIVLFLMLVSGLVSPTVALADILISGVVLDGDGEPVPYATLYIENTNIGTSANVEGIFSIRLPAAGGKNAGTATGNSSGKAIVLIVRAVGYSQTRIEIQSGGETSELEIRLHKESFRMEEVVIGQSEDPAYRIIRQAIKNRKKHLTETPPHTAGVYIKGVQRLLRAPKKFLGVDIDEVGREIGLDSNRTGIVYLSESESRITSDPPNRFKEEMISSKVSGSNRSFSFNRASELQINFYENHQAIIEGLSPRPFISPIADNALQYYRYQYLGFHEENGHTINKIRVIPRRPAEPLYSGDIYIIDGSWRIYGVHLLLTKETSMNLIDSLSIKQEYIPVSPGVWMPASIRFEFQGGLLGFRIGGQYAAVFSDYTLTEPPNKKDFRESLRINAGINKKDSLYWEASRPLALTEEERSDYLKKDSLRRRRESPAYLDSLDRRSNRFKPGAFLAGGYTYVNRAKRSTLSFGGPMTSLSFNTVEGAVLNYDMQYRKRPDSLGTNGFALNGNVRYGFVNHHLNASLGTEITLSRRSNIAFAGGSSVEDLNRRATLSPVFNAYYTLFFGENPLKLYERDFLRGRWNYALPGNVRMSLNGLWENRRWLDNSSTYAFINEKHRHFTPNNPFAGEQDAGGQNPGSPAPPALFPGHQAAQLQILLSYDFSTQYETYPTGKRYLQSKYPRLTLDYTKGIPGLLGSDVDYDLLRFSLSKQDVPLGLYGKFSFHLTGGKFLRNKKLFYPDLWHFNGTQTSVSGQSQNSFLLLDYYRHSTGGTFAEAHGEYNLSTLLTSKIPLVRKLKLQEILGLHLLRTSGIRGYGEFHAGLQWQTVRVIYARSFLHYPAGVTFGKHRQVVRLSVLLP